MKKTDRRKKASKPSIEKLERKIALSAPTQKKAPVPSPYMPGTDYGLLRRSNLREE